MGGRPNIAGSVLGDEVFETDEFAVDLQRGAGVILPSSEARSARRAGNALV